MLDTFIEAASQREQASPLHTRPEEEPPEPASLPFSVRAIVEKHGPYAGLKDNRQNFLINHDRLSQKIRSFSVKYIRNFDETREIGS
jgi:hypothetical protein